MKYKGILFIIFFWVFLILFVLIYFSEGCKMQRKRDTWNRKIKEAMSDTSKMHEKPDTVR
jgi:hypothetical protein